MSYRIAFCGSGILLTLALVAGSDRTAVAQEDEPASLKPFMERLIYPNVRYDEYRWVSDSLVAQGPEAVPLLVEHLHSSSEAVQLRVLGTLSRIGPQSEPALPELQILLRDRNPFIRAASAKCIGALGEAGQPALPDLFLALEDPDEITVGSAARAIDVLQPDFVSSRLSDLLARMGKIPEDVKLLPLRLWYRMARNNLRDPTLEHDLREWTLVAHFAGYDGVRVTDVLGLGAASR